MSTRTATSRIEIATDALLSHALANGVLATANIGQDFQQNSIASGSASQQANRAWEHLSLSITSGGSRDINLHTFHAEDIGAGIERDGLGLGLALSQVVCLVIKQTAGPGRLEIMASQPEDAIDWIPSGYATVSNGGALKSGGVLAWYEDDSTALTINSANRALRLGASNGNVTASIHVLGRNDEEEEQMIFVENVAELRTLGSAFADGDMVFLKSHTEQGDDGGDWFQLNASGGGAADDDGVNISATGGASWVWERRLFGKPITPQMFGAKGDDSTDDTTAIQNAADYLDSIQTGAGNAEGVKPILYFPPAQSYSTTSKIIIKSNIHVRMDGEINYKGSMTSTCLEIGETQLTNYQIDLTLRVRKDVLSDWVSENSIGVKLINSDACNIDIAVGRFTIGMQCMGSGAGWTHNLVKLHRLIDNKIHIDGTNETSGPSFGWFNENLFEGGRISNSTNTRLGLARYSVRITSADGTNVNNNGNMFSKLSHEINTTAASPAQAIPFLVVHGNQNKSIFNRNESNSSVFAIEQNDSVDNEWDYKHTESSIDFQGDTLAASTQSFANIPVVNQAKRLVFDSGEMHRNAVPYDATTTHVPNVNVRARTTGGVVSQTAIDFTVSEQFTVNATTDQLLHTGHTRTDGDVFYVTTTSAVPGGLPVDTKYYVVGAITDRFQGSLTRGGLPVDITNNGVGVHTYHSRNPYIGMDDQRGVGIKVDTTVAKQFSVEGDFVSGFGGRLHVAPFAADGSSLNDNPTRRHVRGDTLFNWAGTSFDGSYRTINDATIERTFVVSDSVKSIEILLSGGSNDVKVRRFKVHTTERAVSPETWVDYEPGEPGRTIAARAPTSSVFEVGRTIWNAVPTEDEPLGWVCSVAGAPGRWRNMPDLPPEESSSSSSTLRSTSSRSSSLNSSSSSESSSSSCSEGYSTSSTTP